jgi:uncharacterized protein
LPAARGRGYDGRVTDSARGQAAGPHCPTCDRPVTWADNSARPFCSLGCKLIDLGGWLDETFRVPGPPVALADSTGAPNSGRDE